jgi:hypothetical protein
VVATTVLEQELVWKRFSMQILYELILEHDHRAWLRHRHIRRLELISSNGMRWCRRQKISWPSQVSGFTASSRGEQLEVQMLRRVKIT